MLWNLVQLFGGFGAVAIGAVSLFLLVLWLFHRSHTDSADKPVHLPTTTPTRRFVRQPIEVADGQRCPGCHGDLAHQEGLHRCHECSSVMHWECYREFGCPTMGCAAAFPKRDTSSDAFRAQPGSEKGDDEQPPKVTLKSKA